MRIGHADFETGGTFRTECHTNSVREDVDTLQNTRTTLVGELDLLVRTPRQCRLVTRRFDGSTAESAGRSLRDVMHGRRVTSGDVRSTKCQRRRRGREKEDEEGQPVSPQPGRRKGRRGKRGKKKKGQASNLEDWVPVEKDTDIEAPPPISPNPLPKSDSIIATSLVVSDTVLG